MQSIYAQSLDLQTLTFSSQFPSLYIEKDFKVELLSIQCFPVYPSCCSGSGVRIPDSGLRIPDSGIRIPDSGFRIPVSGFLGFPYAPLSRLTNKSKYVLYNKNIIQLMWLFLNGPRISSILQGMQREERRLINNYSMSARWI